MTSILGINDGHNAAACLYVDGKVVAALQEERIRRVKNWAGMPTRAIAFVLEAGGLTLDRVDWVAMNGRYAAFPMSREELMEEYRHINDFWPTVRRKARRATRSLATSAGLFGLIRGKRDESRVRDLVALGFPRERILLVEHHEAHAAAAYYGPGDFSEETLVLTADGSGDGVCATVNIGKNGRIERLHQVPMMHSLGNIYAMVTFLMGMVPLEHEYKLMGLAPYADPRGVERVRAKFARLIRFSGTDPLGWEKTDECPETYCSYRFMKRLMEGERFDWVAGGLQKFTEDSVVQWVRNCVRETGISRVALSGGLFMNVKANKLIMELPEVRELFIYPSCGDETNAMGAAYLIYAREAGPEKMAPLRDLYWGPSFTAEQVEEILQGFKFDSPVSFRHVRDVERQVAERLASGQIVARFAGREEFGARALGNRSILANPRDTRVIRVINEAIKSRDFWMPFATSLMKERADRYIVNPKGIPSPHMILSFDTTDRREEISAGIHPFDYTVRPQLLDRDWNPGYHEVMSEFEKLTGIGGVLNTSFNLHGSPIVSTPWDALDVFNRSGLSVLALADWVVEKT
jgi:carbamoyltransferase